MIMNNYLSTAKKSVVHPPCFVLRPQQGESQNGGMPSHGHAIQKENHMYKHRLSILLYALAEALSMP